MLTADASGTLGVGLGALVMAVAALALLTRPWWTRRRTTPRPAVTPAASSPSPRHAMNAPIIDTLRDQIRQLDLLRDSGSLGPDAHAQARSQLEQQLVAAVLTAPLPTPGSPDVTQGVAPEAAVSATASRQRGLRPLLATAAVVLAVAGGAGYWATQTQSPTAALADAGAAPASGGGGAEGGDNANAAHALGRQQLVAMADGLAQRLAQKPDDGDGWAMLARTYAVMGEHGKAVPAFRKAEALRRDDAMLLADHADALAMLNQRRLGGEPLALVQRALKLEPGNLKALSLAGTEAFDRQDWKAALAHWDKLQSLAGADDVLARQVQGGIDEARQRLQGQAPGAGQAAAPGSTASAAAAATRASVAGTVSLAAAVRAQAGPDDTVFVFARPADGSRMPLALLRKQVKDLPLRFSLDDSLAMSPAARLSGHRQVIVGARVSKSGQATPQPGDLQGQSAVVALGTADVRVEIGQTVGR